MYCNFAVASLTTPAAFPIRRGSYQVVRALSKPTVPFLRSRMPSRWFCNQTKCRRRITMKWKKASDNSTYAVEVNCTRCENPYIREIEAGENRCPTKAKQTGRKRNVPQLQKCHHPTGCPNSGSNRDCALCHHRVEQISCLSAIRRFDSERIEGAERNEATQK